MPVAMPPPAPAAPAASVAVAELARKGPDWLVARYYSSCGDGSGARRAAAGDPGWVRITARLGRTPLASACDGEVMQLILGEALLANPSAVLPLIGHGYTAAELCPPDRFEPTAARLRADRRALRTTLAKVHAPALAAAKAACEARLASIMTSGS